MPETRFVVCAAAIVFLSAGAAAVRAEDAAKPAAKTSAQPTAAGSKAAGDEFVPGFESEKLTWAEIERIELIEGKQSTTAANGAERAKHVSFVRAYRFADGGGKPVSVEHDPLATPLPQDPDKLDRVARLKERGVAWKEQLLKHNPAVRLDAVHADTQSRMQLIGGARITNKVHFKEALYTPSEELVTKARAVDAAAVQQKTQGHTDNKSQAKLLYVGANVVLGCAAALIVGFLILPAFRRRNAVPKAEP